MTARKKRATLALAAALLLIAPAAFALAAQNVDLTSPRATFDSYLTAMNQVEEEGETALERAAACLDLSAFAASVRGEAGKRLARDLKTFLDKWELIELDRIPAETERERWVYLKVPEGEVSLFREEDGRWLFSGKTLASLPALLDFVADREFVEGLRGGGAGPTTVGGWIRERVPAQGRAKFFLLEIWQWVGLLVVIFLGVVADRIVRHLAGISLARLWKKGRQLVDRETALRFQKPIGILAGALIWSLLLRLLDLPVHVLNVLVIAVRVVMASAGVWAAYRFMDVLGAYLASLARRTESTLDDLLVPLIRRALKILIIVVGVLFVAQNLNVNVSSLIAGLGIGGLAFALAAKDTVENLFGSFTVLMDRPFQIGDWVVIGDLEGTVEELGLRSTRIRTFYNSVITVPNSRLVHTAVDNLGARRHRRVKCMISVQYDTPPERLDAFCEGIRELIRRHPYTRKDYYMVYFNEFADSALNILLYAFHQTPDWPTELRERHRLFTDIVRLARRLGVEFAFPTRTLHLASAPAGLGRPEPEKDPAPPSTPEQELSREALSTDEAMVLGRSEAEAIMSGQWPGGAQPPVDFGRPDRVRPGTAEEGEEG
jgi:MscS family membrane protein